MMNPPFVSLLIPVKNVRRYIEKCLDALTEMDYPKNRYEILVLDNKSTDGTIELVLGYAKRHPQIKLIQCGHDWPPIKYNQIIDKTKGDILGFVDGDAIVGKEWLKKVVEPLMYPNVAGATSMVYTYNKDKLLPRIIGYEFLDRYERAPEKVTRVTTMCTVYKKSVIKEIGGFNEKLKTGYDGEIGHRIKNEGYDIVVVKNAHVYHNNRTTLKAYFNQQFEYSQWAIIRNLQNLSIARGDETTPFWMVIQPLIYLIIFSSIFLGFFMGIFYKLAIGLAIILLISYMTSAIRLSIKFGDIGALYLMVLYLTRGIAWTLGGVYTVTIHTLEKVLKLVKTKKY